MSKLKDQPTQIFTQGDVRPGSNAAGALFSFVERIERLDEERAAAVADMKEVRAEAKGMGFDTKILGKVIARRKLDPAAREETDSMVELYEEAVRQEEKRRTAESQEQGT